MLYHSPLNINLCWIPSHCGVLGNEQADRVAKRATDEPITEIKIPKLDMLRIIKTKINQYWQNNFNYITTYKIKDKIGHWDSSFNVNRKKETILARLRLNCVRDIHLVPHIEGTFPLNCNCDGSRLSLNHIFFDCSYFIIEREPLIKQLYNDKKNLTLKSILDDSEEYCKLSIDFLKSINLYNKI